MLTERERRRLSEMVNVEGASTAAAAVEFGVGSHTAHQAVIDHSDPAIKDPVCLDGVRGIGVDEKCFLNTNGFTSHNNNGAGSSAVSASNGLRSQHAESEAVNHT